MDNRPTITITVAGSVGTGKSAVALAILDALRACGVEATWDDEGSERNLGTGAQDIAALGPKPVVNLVEVIQRPDPIGDVLATVRAELDRAVAKFPTWPTDPLHASGVVQEEAGELAKAVLQAVYEPHKSGPTQVFEEAVQTAAMAVRFLLSSARYTYVPGEQHTQLLGEAPPLVGTGEGEALPDFAQLPRIAPPVAPEPFDDDEHYPVTDPAEMNAALVSIAQALGVTPTLDDMLHAIDALTARAIDRRTEQAISTALGCDETAPAILAAIHALKGPHHAMHHQLLQMLGAQNHQGAAARIGELAGLELLLNAGGAGKGVTAIAQERRRQIEREGYAPSEDDGYTCGELAQAAAAYVLWEWSEADDREAHLAIHWPGSWNPDAFKPKDRRSDLVRAGALIAAELDRLDRRQAEADDGGRYGRGTS